LLDDLIIDVGAHNGDDSGFYLHEGYRVVAVEANPVLAASIADRFKAAVADGRLTVLNVGISDRSGVQTFWINDVNTVWSSFDEVLARRNGSGAHAVPVHCVRLESILREHGLPHYLKIDIEGHDRICLDSLRPDQCPRYLSSELTHGNGLIDRLHTLGYRRFKLINQATYTEASPIFENEIPLRALRKLCTFVPAVKRWVPNGWRIEFDTNARPDYRFPPGSSGPFGEDTFGPWRTKDDVERRYRDIRERFVRAGVSLEVCWFDVHATTS
jgi:FkbM family methyltransferase